jgi:hypothetical protein
MLRISAAAVACICLALALPQAHAQDIDNSAAPASPRELTIVDLALAKGELERALVELKQAGELTESGYTKLLADIEKIEGKLRAENPDWFEYQGARSSASPGYDQQYRSSVTPRAHGPSVSGVATPGQLTIQLGADGSVSVEGDGVAEERLELIREHLGAGAVHLKEGVSIDTADGDTTITIETGPRVMRLSGLQGLEGLEGLENLRVLELEGLQGLQNLPELTPEQLAKIAEGRAQVLRLRQDGSLDQLRGLQLDEERLARLRSLAEQLRSAANDEEREALAAELRELALQLKELSAATEGEEDTESE